MHVLLVETEAEAVRACEQASLAPYREAAKATSVALADAGIEADVAVLRADGGVRVQLALDPGVSRTAATLLAAAAVRRILRDVGIVDVTTVAAGIRHGD